MGTLSKLAATLVEFIPFPFWGLRFRVYGLTGTCRYGGGQLRVLYAGTEPFARYFKTMTFSDSPDQEFFGTYSIFDLERARQGLGWDLEVFRSHKKIANLGLFPTGLFVPEWLSGTSDLREQRRNEELSRTRKRDRRLMVKNDVSYVVTTNAKDLNHFYDEMYLPHMHQKHRESVLLMPRIKMLSEVGADQGELVQIRIGGKAVGGSFIIRENGRPRLYSQGILGNEKDFMRQGIGTAIYLCSFDHLTKCGFDDVHMGWSRAFLADGSLYFKRRFGFRIEEVSETGHFFRCPNVSEPAGEWLKHMGALYYRRGETRAALFGDSSTSGSDATVRQKRVQAESLGLDGIDVIDLNQVGATPFAEAKWKKQYR